MGKPRSKGTKTKPRKLDPSKKWSLDELEAHVPKVPANDVALVRDGLIKAIGDDGLVELGAAFATEDILGAVPGFAVGAILAMSKLEEPPVGLAPAFLPLLVNEARQLERVNSAYEQESRNVGGEIAGRREKLKRANSAALRKRRVVAQTLMRHILPAGDSRRAKLQKAAAKAPTPATAAASARAVANVVEELRREGALTALLDAYKYDARLVASLRQLADSVEALGKTGTRALPPLLTDQRALDRQDGLVLAIVRAIWVPLREEAEATDGSFAMPPLGPIERLVVSPANGEEDDAEPAPAQPASPTGTETPTET